MFHQKLFIGFIPRELDNRDLLAYLQKFRVSEDRSRRLYFDRRTRDLPTNYRVLNVFEKESFEKILASRHVLFKQQLLLWRFNGEETFDRFLTKFSSRCLFVTGIPLTGKRQFFYRLLSERAQVLDLFLLRSDNVFNKHYGFTIVKTEEQAEELARLKRLKFWWKPSKKYKKLNFQLFSEYKEKQEMKGKRVMGLGERPRAAGKGSSSGGSGDAYGAQREEMGHDLRRGFQDQDPFSNDFYGVGERMRLAGQGQRAERGYLKEDGYQGSGGRFTEHQFGYLQGTSQKKDHNNININPNMSNKEGGSWEGSSTAKNQQEQQDPLSNSKRGGLESEREGRGFQSLHGQNVASVARNSGQGGHSSHQNQGGVVIGPLIGAGSQIQHHGVESSNRQKIDSNTNKKQRAYGHGGPIPTFGSILDTAHNDEGENSNFSQNKNFQNSAHNHPQTGSEGDKRTAQPKNSRKGQNFSQKITSVNENNKKIYTKNMSPRSKATELGVLSNPLFAQNGLGGPGQSLFNYQKNQQKQQHLAQNLPNQQFQPPLVNQPPRKFHQYEHYKQYSQFQQFYQQQQQGLLGQPLFFQQQQQQQASLLYASYSGVTNFQGGFGYQLQQNQRQQQILLQNQKQQQQQQAQQGLFLAQQLAPDYAKNQQNQPLQANQESKARPKEDERNDGESPTDKAKVEIERRGMALEAAHFYLDGKNVKNCRTRSQVLCVRIVREVAENHKNLLNIRFNEGRR